MCNELSVPLNPALCCEGKTCHTIHWQNLSSSVFKIVIRNNTLPAYGLWGQLMQFRHICVMKV